MLQAEESAAELFLCQIKLKYRLHKSDSMQKEKKMRHMKKLWAFVLSAALVFGILAIPVSVQAANVTLTHTKGKNASDVRTLKKIIAQQKEKGVKLSADLDEDVYMWSEDGRLTGIRWYGLKGRVSFSGLSK